MPITINGSGTITGLSTGGLPDGSVDADTLASNAVTTVKINDDAVTDAKQSLSGTAKAWANFDGSAANIGSTLTSYNIGSITDNGVGDYTLNFTNNLANSNYAVIACAHDDNVLNNNYGYGLVSNDNAWIGGTYYTTSSARVTFGYPANDFIADVKRAMVAIFGD